ncbi:MAG: hypothetical protein WD266_00180 [Balneolales bacterium]
MNDKIDTNSIFTYLAGKKERSNFPLPSADIDSGKAWLKSNRRVGIKPAQKFYGVSIHEVRGSGFKFTRSTKQPFIDQTSSKCALKYF